MGLERGQSGSTAHALNPSTKLLPATTCHSFKSLLIKIVCSTKATQLNKTQCLVLQNPQANRVTGIYESGPTEESAGHRE